MSTTSYRFEKRKAAVGAIQRGEDIYTVSRIMEIPVRTLFSWLARYRAGGLDSLKDGKRSGRPRIVSAEVIKWLYNAIVMGDPRQYQMEFCLWTLNIIRELLKKKYGLNLSKSSISRLLSQMGLSPQRPIYKSYKRDPKKLEKYLKKTFPELKQFASQTGAIIYFIDEASVRSDNHRGTTWSLIGHTPEVQDSGSRFSVRLISAVTARGDMRFETIKDSMDSERFIAFLKNLKKDTQKPIIAIVDNARYHISKKTREFVDNSQGDISLEYLPSYSPELNPDEQVWNHMKLRLSKLFIANKEAMRSKVACILRSIQRNRELIQSFFRMPDTIYACS